VLEGLFWEANEDLKVLLELSDTELKTLAQGQHVIYRLFDVPPDRIKKGYVYIRVEGHGLVLHEEKDKEETEGRRADFV
jgi:CRP-like cAMP-binding protein